MIALILAPFAVLGASFFGTLILGGVMAFAFLCRLGRNLSETGVR